MLVADALRDPSTGPKGDQVARIEDDEQVVVLILGHLNILEDTHRTGRGECRFVQMDEECHPPSLGQQTQDILANNFRLQLGSQRAHTVLVLVVKHRGVIGIFLTDDSLAFRRSTSRLFGLVIPRLRCIRRPNRARDIATLLPRHGDIRMKQSPVRYIVPTREKRKERYVECTRNVVYMRGLWLTTEKTEIRSISRVLNHPCWVELGEFWPGCRALIQGVPAPYGPGLAAFVAETPVRGTLRESIVCAKRNNLLARAWLVMPRMLRCIEDLGRLVRWDETIIEERL